MSDKDVEAILSAPGIAERLLSLDLSFCSDLHYGNSSLMLANKLKLVPNLLHLKVEYLTMDDNEMRPGEPEPNPDEMTFNNLPLLETLHTCGVHNNPEDISKLTHLKDLSMSDLYSYGPILAVAPQLTRLMPVNFGFPRADGESKIAQFYRHATNLRVLDASRLNVQSPVNPLQLIEAVPNLEKGTLALLSVFGFF
jgi:hypothetical protein